MSVKEFEMPSFLADLAKASHRAVITPWGTMYEVDPGKKTDTLIKVIKVNFGHRTSLQYHTHKEEVLIILDGTGWIEIHGDVVSKRTVRNRPIHLVSGVCHRAVGPLLLLEVSTHYPDDVVRIEDDYGRAPC